MFPLAPDLLRAPARRGGFALLVTIVLVAFLVLILVGLASFSRVETQVAGNAQVVSRARQNALFALNLAVGQLQQAAGPDLRLTSRADLVGAGQNAHFTGVWRPGEAEPFTWLVSGNELASDAVAATPGGSPSPGGAAGVGEVFLLGDASVAGAADRVKLPLRPITAAPDMVPGLGGGVAAPVTVGHFAYWIGDEGVKASAALHDQTDELDYDNRVVGAPPANSPTTGVNWPAESESRARLRQLAPAHPHLPKLFSGYTPGAGVNDLLPQTLNYSQLAFLDPAGLTRDDLRARFHDATTVSRAVLADHTVAPDGGLRQDLSDSPDVFPSAIRNFVKERADSMTGLQARHAQKRSENGADSAFPMFSKGPVLTEFVVRFQFYRRVSDGLLMLKYEMQAELWNPYAFTLNGVADLRLQLANLPIVTVEAGAGGVATAHEVNLNTNAAFNLALDPSISWAPGQIRRVKGAGGSAYGPAGPARNVAVTTVAGGAADISGAQSLDVSIPPVPASGSGARFRVELRSQGNTLAVYAPEIDFAADTAGRPVGDDLSSNAGWLFGYAFDFRDDVRDWTDPTRVTAQDPRRTNLAGDFFEPADSAWSDLPGDNVGEINLAGADTFNETGALALFDLPRQEPVSVGSLQHVVGERPYRLGNPNVAPMVSVNDYFDRYYFSTLPRWHAWDPRDPPALPNRYIQVYSPDPANPPPLGDRMGANGATADYLLDRTHAAKYLLLRGAFNINSTSEAAWRAVLGGIQIPGWSHGGAAPVSTDLANAFFRFSQGAQEFAADPNAPPSAADAFARGARTLDDAQVAALAAAVVARLKARGRPFATLRDFLDDGVITAAIAVANINAADPDDVPPYSPGWLSQADVMTALAPFVTPRSDTFRVRAYGDVRNPATGETEGRAWCEAVVQRFPDLTPPAFGSPAPATDPLAPSAAKYPFGRQFKIISFQWLSPDDI